MLPLQFHLHMVRLSRIRTIKRRPHLTIPMWDLKELHTIRKRVGLEVPRVVAVLCAVYSSWGGKMLGIFA